MNLLRKTKLSGFLLILLLLMLWELSAVLNWVQLPSWKSVSSIIATLFQFVMGGELLYHVMMSLKRMFIGYLLAAAVGIGLGLIMGYYRFFYQLFEPITEFLRPIPTPAYIPIAILFFGIGDTMKIFTIAVACFFPVLLNTYSGVKSVDGVQINTGRTFGLSSGGIMLKISLPVSLPYIFSGLRVSLGIGLILAVISEMVAANDGIGYFILSAQRSFMIEKMYAGVFALGIVGYALNVCFVFIERRVLKWHYGSTSNS